MRRLTRPSVMKETSRITPRQRGQTRGIDLVHPSNELSPGATQGGQRRGRGETRRRSVFARPWRERLCLLGLAAGLQLAAHDVRVGAVVDAALAKTAPAPPAKAAAR
jgi:hypothetical protein